MTADIYSLFSLYLHNKSMFTISTVSAREEGFETFSFCLQNPSFLPDVVGGGGGSLLNGDIFQVGGLILQSAYINPRPLIKTPTSLESGCCVTLHRFNAGSAGC